MDLEGVRRARHLTGLSRKLGGEAFGLQASQVVELH